MIIPDWALALSYWAHMLITVVWLGSLATLALFVLPSMQRTLPAHDFAVWLANLNRRMDPFGWFSLGLLTFTGLLQMDSSPNYLGLFDVSNPWAVAICGKHIAFAGMIAISATITWNVSPALQRAALQRARGRGAGREQLTLSRFQRLNAVNLLLGVIVLVFTALARVS